MSIQQLKELFGNQEAVLELVQLEGGELALVKKSVLLSTLFLYALMMCGLMRKFDLI